MPVPQQTLRRTVIFLDIDGVLQPPSSQKRFKHDLEELRRSLADRFDDEIYLGMDKYDLGAVYFDWDSEAVERLHSLCNDFGARRSRTGSGHRRTSLCHQGCSEGETVRRRRGQPIPAERQPVSTKGNRSTSSASSSAAPPATSPPSRPPTPDGRPPVVLRRHAVR